MTKKLPIDQINEVASFLPTAVLEDVYNRMNDWISSGGDQDDPYMYQQARYALMWAKKMES